ncbi:N-acyl-D-amino-acid deacylase family protein [Photobacterium alginatilyticum]|uniref:D-aminoacylase n=1 Tax=Photobacterium alginatilyticum TaxID=1775171 RepID=A0ABW9YNY7_9GAMM|nr:amidohydrolase family protein [Photobacterium alginatilyticum]NBI55531.1 D-aminoacylase [Photobacterium alginatilyticum]
MRQLIKNAVVVDGSGGNTFSGDVLIDGEFIASVAPRIDERADVVIEAHGAYLAPGFIDVHSHADLATFVPKGFKPKVLQGITTELVGLCGLGVAPLPKHLQPELRDRLIIGNPPVDWNWDDYASYCHSLSQHGLEVNLSAFLPHGLLRYQICGNSHFPMSSQQRCQLAKLTDETLAAGARGISLGLIYHPALFSDKEELLTVAQVAAQHRKPLVVHVRSESDEILEAVQEMVAISQQAGCQLHISHLKLIGRRNAAKLDSLLALIDRHNLTFDQYPYHYGSTTLFSILPPALIRTYAPDELMNALNTQPIRRQVKDWFSERLLPQAGEPWDNLPALVGWENILICEVETPSARQWLGQSVSECARQTDQHPVDFVLDLLVSERGNVRMIDYFMDEALVERIFTHPRGMVGTDTIFGGQIHPRVSGTFPRILNQFVKHKQLLPLEQAIHKMTALSAETFGLRKRGKIASGYYADISLFGADFSDHSTIDQPDAVACGLRELWVNGCRKVAGGEYLETRSGQLLHHWTDNRHL